MFPSSALFGPFLLLYFLSQQDAVSGKGVSRSRLLLLLVLVLVLALDFYFLRQYSARRFCVSSDFFAHCFFLSSLSGFFSRLTGITHEFENLCGKISFLPATFLVRINICPRFTNRIMGFRWFGSCCTHPVCLILTYNLSSQLSDFSTALQRNENSSHGIDSFLFFMGYFD